MIVSASYRTDIPAFYGEWFKARLAAGYCRVTSPYGGKPYAVALTREAVDGFVFWTRNLRPFRPHLSRIGRDYPFYVQFTVTGNPRSLEPGVVATDRAIDDLQWLAREFGPRRGIWRYDPIVVTSATPPDWHRTNFAAIAAQLEGAVDEVVMSFAHGYAKTRRNLDAAAARSGFAWRDPEDGEKRALAGELAAIASRHGMKAALCSQNEYRGEGVEAAQCIDAARLGDIAGGPFKSRVRGNRPDCLCHESRDIGAYDTCPQGCAYCYAVRNQSRAKDHLARHDPGAETLG
jgi:hypothetical protein